MLFGLLRCHAAWLLLACASSALAQIPGTMQGTSSPPSTTDNGKIDSAESAAQDIVDSLDGDAKKEAERCLKAFKAARKDNRVVKFTMPEPPPGKKAPPKPRGWTTPDVPASLGGGTAEYWISQTCVQFIGLESTFLARACPCAIAVVILHEGWRAEQHCPANPTTNAQLQQVVQNNQQMAAQDLRNIAKARTVCQGTDPACKDELDALEGEARDFLAKMNKIAGALTNAGLNAPAVPAPN